MLKVLNQTDIKSFNSVRKEYPYSRILMRINTLDDREGQILAVSDSTESDDGIYTANCELYILDKRNAAMQFIIDTGASITCCRAKELGVNLSEDDFIVNKSNTRYLNGVLNFHYFGKCVCMGDF